MIAEINWGTSSDKSEKPGSTPISSSIGEARKTMRGISLFDISKVRAEAVHNLIAGIALLQHLISTAGEQIDPLIALIGLPEFFAVNDPTLELILRLKKCGWTILAFADGVNRWDIPTKCRPILAGARCLLDSMEPDFKPLLISEVESAVADVVESRQTLRRVKTLMLKYGIIGESLPITRAFESAILFSDKTDLPVLITGETGTGKELFARAIAGMDRHYNGGPFVAVNCAAIQPTMAESEVFGHRRGAFTGADRDRKGWIRSADRGALFLDEVGEMDFALQSKFLRVLQDSRVRGVGEDSDVEVKTRFLAATNRNLEEMVQKGAFRNDLLNRLHVLNIRMPSLVERVSDIRVLVEHFVDLFQSKFQQAVLSISDDYIKALENVPLPGNVRELENIVHRSLARPRHAGRLSLADLPLEILSRLATPNLKEQPSAGSEPIDQIPRLVRHLVKSHGWNLHTVLLECEKIVCQEALALAQGNQTEAARLLGVTPRCVYKKVHTFGK